MAPSIIARDGPELGRDIAAQIEHHLVDIAPAPSLGRIIALDDGMLAAVEMLGGMLVLGGVAAADMPAGPADAQMQPFIAAFEAFLATLGAGRDLGDGIQVRTKIRVAHCAASRCAASR